MAATQLPGPLYEIAWSGSRMRFYCVGPCSLHDLEAQLRPSTSSYADCKLPRALYSQQPGAKDKFLELKQVGQRR